MRKTLYAIIFTVFFVSTSAMAENCGHLWFKESSIDSKNGKFLVGDTFAVYSLMGFKHEENLELVFESEFPVGRFMSFESYLGKNKQTYKMLIDKEIEPLPGNKNPYRPENQMNVQNRKFRVVAGLKNKGYANFLELAPDTDIHSVYYRFYVPSDGEVTSDSSFPTVFARDARTGLSRPCPEAVDTIYSNKLIARMIGLYPPALKFRFDRNIFVSNGTNQAVPDYLYNFTRTPRRNRVAMVLFKAPSFFNSQDSSQRFNHHTQVRYWSMCTTDLIKLHTYDCLPDYKATVRSDGYVLLVVSGEEEVRHLARERGQNFLPDRRRSGQGLLQLLYRNLLPNGNFDYYQGTHHPIGVVCSVRRYRKGKCLERLEQAKTKYWN